MPCSEHHQTSSRTLSPLEYADKLTLCEGTLVTNMLSMEDMNECENMESYADIYWSSPCLISNLMHKILIYLRIIHLLKSTTCFKHYPAHLQEVYVVIVYMQPLVQYTITT